MSDEPDERNARVVATILRYLASHPHAADSERGIAEWWLPAMGVEATQQEVAEAIRHLEQLGVLTRQVLPDGRVVHHASDAWSPPGVIQ